MKFARPGVVTGGWAPEERVCGGAVGGGGRFPPTAMMPVCTAAGLLAVLPRLAAGDVALSMGVDGHGTTRGARCCGCPAPMVALGARALSRSWPLAALALTAVPAEPGGDGGGLRDASGRRVGRAGLSPERLGAATSSGPGAVGRTGALALSSPSVISRSSDRFSWPDVVCVSSSEGWLDWLLPCDTGCTRLGSAKTLLAGGGRPGGRP